MVEINPMNYIKHSEIVFTNFSRFRLAPHCSNHWIITIELRFFTPWKSLLATVDL